MKQKKKEEIKNVSIRISKKLHTALGHAKADGEFKSLTQLFLRAAAPFINYKQKK